MPYRHLLKLAFAALILVSCKKNTAPSTPPPTPVQPAPSTPAVLIKDISTTSLPSPFYHFEYNSDSLPSTVNFASGFSVYDVLYTAGKIAEMRNNTLENHDTLRYFYDPTGKLSTIKFIDQTNVTFRQVGFRYNGDRVTEIDWTNLFNAEGFLNRIVKFEYYADGNLKTMIEDITDPAGISPESTDTTRFEQYDAGINVEDFSLIHIPFNDHLFLLQGFRLQKNNPAKVTFTQPSGVNNYTVNYTYTYNNDNTPSKNEADILLTGTGPGTGTHTHAATTYTYY